MFSIQKYGGITKYFCELMRNYPEDHNFQLSVLFSNNQHLKDNFKFLKKIYVPIPEKKSKINGYLKSKSYNINKLYSEHVISNRNYDLLHPTFYDTYFLKGLKKPYVVTVHDLAEFKFKNQYKNNSRIPAMEQIIQNARRIISISESTKKDLIEILNINPEIIDVVYHGFRRGDFQMHSNLNGRYILYVGVRQGYKNFNTLLRSFADLKIEDNDLKLICVGSPFSTEEISELKKLRILENTVALRADETRLNSLYANALAFVYPSLHEGFGMPILEAFAHNCPVCLSNTSCFPEIAGSGGVYFNPTDPDSITKAIKKVIYDTNFSKKMIEEGNKRLNQFSWKKCSLETIISYKKALS